MAQILKFARPIGWLEPEELELLGDAYDKALARLNDHASSELCEIVAGRIIFAGMKGQRDVTTLCATALRGIVSPTLG